jgi:hypothetical protein
MNDMQTNLKNGDPPCRPFDVCRDCHPPAPPPNEEWLHNCTAIDYKRYYVRDYYHVIGAEKMKSELYVHGPISCGMYLSPNLIMNYKGGIYSEKVDNVLINHDVSVVGYKVDEKTGQEYWVVRNSMGTNWGDYGFFYIQMNKDNLGIETDCLAGRPTFFKP